MFPSGQTFLSTTLSGLSAQQLCENPTPLPTGTLCWQSAGILTFQYQSVSDCWLILSAGIHGNETAPVEMLDAIVTDLLKGTLKPSKNCMFILGNPPALAGNVRFTSQDLNRLFQSPGLQPGPQQALANSEQHRAKAIMQAVEAFVKDSSTVLHYDLHTSLRPSAIERFALFPYAPARSCPQHQLAFLARSGIQALINQSQTTPTFSSWTAANCRAESFTLELGSVHKFGENKPETTQALDQELRMLLTSAETNPTLAPIPSSYPQQFTVVHEIINTGKGFRLTINEDAPDFSQYHAGCEIWRNDDEAYYVDDGPVFVVFANARAGEGERAGLLVKNSTVMLV